MKKSKIWISILALFAIAAISVGCQTKNNSSAYDQAMTAGKTAVADKKYDKAHSEFNHAYSIKKTKEAKAYAAQASDMKQAIDAALKSHFDDGIESVTKAIDEPNGYSVLIKQAKSLNNTLNKCQENYENDIQPLQDKADEAEANSKFQDAIDAYQSILDLPYINEKYYKAIKNDAKKGIKRDKAKLKDNKPIKNSENSTSQANANNASKSVTATSKVNPNEGINKAGDHKVDGQTVSSANVSQIRSQLKSLGINPGPWSDQDIINLYRSAAANGHKTPDSITKDDVSNYLKH